MSRIVLVIDNPGPSLVPVISAVRACAGASFRDIKQSIENGRPVIDQSLFSRDDTGFPSRLLSLVSDLDRLGVEYRAAEIPNGQFADATDLTSFFQVTHQRLENLIASREQSVRRLRADVESGDRK